MEMNFASRGVANTGLALGATALGLSVLNGNGILGGLFGGNCGCSENMAVNRYELDQQKVITDREAEIAYLKGRDAAKTDSLELYKYVDGRFRGIEAQIANQAVYNATNTAAINCINGQVAQLMALTKTVIPVANICPIPAVATTPTTTG
jgi:hypothetical protein